LLFISLSTQSGKFWIYPRIEKGREYVETEQVLYVLFSIIQLLTVKQNLLLKCTSKE